MAGSLEKTTSFGDVRDRRLGLWTFVVVFILLAAFSRFRASVTGAPDLSNPDERLMTYIVLDRFGGANPMALEWPAGPLQAFGVPLVALDYAVHNRINPDSLVQYLGNAYRRPWHVVRLLRWIVAATCAFGVALFGVMVFRTTRDPGMAIMVSLASGTVPLFWSHSRAFTGDAVSIGWMFAAIAVTLLGQSGLSYIVAGTALGLAVTSKYPIALLGPLLLALTIGTRGQKTTPLVSGLALMAVAFAITILVFLPQLWTDPLRAMKAVGGAITRPGEPGGTIGALNWFVKTYPAWATVVIPVGIAAAFTVGDNWLGFGLLFSAALEVFIVGREGVIYPRYLMGMTILSALSMCAIARWLAQQSRRAYWIGTALFASFVLINVVIDVRLPIRLSYPTIAEALAERATADPSVKTVALSWYDAYDGFEFASAASLNRHAASCAEALATELRGGSRFHMPIPPAFAQYVPGVFADDESVCAVRSRLMAAVPADSPEVDLVVWGWGDLADRFGVPSVDQVIADFRAGKIGAIVSRVPLPNVPPRQTWKNGLTAY